jgi:DNA-binding IclR family transcriptional regulator
MVTGDLQHKARCLSPDARAVVLDVADHGPGTYAEIAQRTGLSIERVRKACQSLQRGLGYMTVQTTIEYGLGLYGRGTAIANAVRELMPSLPLEGD